MGMMTLMNWIVQSENLNRWYLVSIQSTLFFSCAVIIAWGRRDNSFQQWRAIPVESLDQAQELADRIVKKKLRRGYRIIQSPFQAANS